MSPLFKSSLIMVVLAASAPAFAGGNGFESNIKAPVTTAIDIEVSLSNDMANRANNLPKKLSDRGNSRRIRDGFANNGYYGDKDLGQLIERLESKLEASFAKQGLQIVDGAPVTLNVVLVDAKPNRPTFAQMSKDSSLSMQSFANGGAEIMGELIASDGREMGTVSYRYYETDIQNAQYGGTWSDSHKAISRYASKTAKALSK